MRTKGLVASLVFLLTVCLGHAAERLPTVITPAAIIVDRFENGRKTSMFEMWDVSCHLPTLNQPPDNRKPACRISSVMIWENPSISDPLGPSASRDTAAQVVIEWPIESDEVRWLRATQDGNNVFFVRSVDGTCGPTEITLTVRGAGNHRRLVDLSARTQCGSDCKTECTYSASHDKVRRLQLPIMNGLR